MYKIKSCPILCSYETFRDKLLPGANEKWKVKITGNKGEKIAAEMLAGMYDASLDQFKAHSWRRPYIWPGLYNTIYWNINGFTKVSSEEFSRMDYTYLTAAAKSYDQLLSFDGYGGRYYRGDGMVSTRMVTMGNASQMPPPPPSPGRKYKKGEVTEEIMADVAISTLTVTTDSITFDMKTKGKEADKNQTSSGSVQIRKNFNETAFFFP